MRTLVLAIVTAATAAHADGLPTAGHVETVIELTATARNLARDGRCEALPAIAARVQALDEDYYARVYTVDPAISHCAPIDPRLQMGAPPSLTPSRPVPAPSGPAKNPTTAVLLSLGVTAGGLGLDAIGGAVNSQGVATVGAILFVVGPTTGHIYADHPWNAGLGMRLVGAGATVISIPLLFTCFDGCSDHSSEDLGAALLIGGGLLYLGGTVFEIATAGEAAHRYNREHGIEASIVPTGRGLAIAGRF